MVPGMRAAKLSGRCKFGSGNHLSSEGLGSEAGLTLLEIVVAGAILSVALMAVHYSATLAWSLHRKGSFSSENTIHLWNRSCRFRANPEREGTPFILNPDLRPLRQVVLERNGLEWEVIRAR